MSGLMRRLTRGRAATDDEATPQASAASEPVSATPDAQQGGSGLPANGTAPSAAEEPRTAVLGDATKPGGDAKTGETKVDATAVDAPAASDLPAGVDPGRLAAVPSSARRGRLRRRLRYLRAVREILLRDIGGFYYEAQRAEDGVEPHRALLDAKAARLARLDDEVRDLESRLDEPRATTILREPGLGGTCPACGELHASDARYCSRCGTALSVRAARSRTTAAGPSGPLPAVSASSDDGKATTASLWGRPKRLDPATQAAPDEATQAAAPEESEKPAATKASDEPVANEPAATSETDKPAAERA
jgi:hypothetical protein